MSGYRKDQKRAKRKKPLSHGWIVVPSKSYRDRVYFYNIITKCSSWINPCEVLDDETASRSSSDTSVESTKHKSTTHPPRKRTSGENIPFSAKENYETEDCDQHFDKGPVSELNLSHSTTISPRDTPDSTFSFKSNKSDSESSKNNMSFENDKKELWLHFASTPKKNNWKKSLALSDFDQPSTSSKSGNEKHLPMGGSYNEDFKESKNRGVKNRKKKRSRKSEGGIVKKETKRSGDKTAQNIAFMMKDKTPAQTGILKFRREYAEKIKKMLDVSPPFKSKPEKNKNYNASCSSGTVECLDYVNFNDHSRQNIEVNDDQVSNYDFSEEMDWEPSSEESDVRNINEFRQQQNLGQTSNNTFCELNGYQKTALPSQTQELVTVLDTNIFVSCLSFVKELRDTKIGDSSYPIIYVPWRVLQELDHLKDNKIGGAKKLLSLNVRKAISFLNENFKFKHPRVFGQSFEDFNNMIDNNFAADDEILQTCIQLKKRHSEIKLVLLTNDKNLESKANVSGVKVFSKESFEKTYMSRSSLSPPPSSNSSKVILAAQSSVQIDSYVCQVKALLKEFLSIVVETEMRIAFEEDWIRVIHKKPPWTTKEALNCFLKHWRSVFFLIFSKVTLKEAENLNEKLFSTEPANLEDVLEIIAVFQRFIRSINSSQKKKRPYLDFSGGLMATLSSLSKEISLNDGSQDDGRMSQAQVPSFLTSSESCTQAQPNTDEITPLDISKVKNLFRDIWESLRCFCCSMSDVVNSPSPGSNTSLPELRLKLVQILNETGELISSLEKIFEINLPDVNERHPLIIHFAHFLSNLYPAINLDVQNKLPKCLAAFFTDYEGRSLLSRSLNDFREFSQELIKTSEFFKAHFQ